MDMTNRECERLIRAADKILEAVVKGGPDASLTMVVEGEGDENTFTANELDEAMVFLIRCGLLQGTGELT